MISSKYYNQVQLLLKILPFVAKEKCFALKGGTAINLFYNNAPRLSVDIDLAYINFDDRKTAYKNINCSLKNISNSLNKVGYSVSVKGNEELKLICKDTDNTTIKIEPNYVIRGTVKDIKTKSVCSNISHKFGYTEMQLLSKEELYAGKICAAVDRQHPRDLFDIWYLLKKGNIPENVKNCFVIYALMHPKNLYELFNPVLKEQESIFEAQFAGMTDEKFTYKDHIKTFNCITKWIKKSLTAKDKKFLLDFVQLNNNLQITKNYDISKLPAIKWKIKNLQLLKDNNPKKFKEQYIKLKSCMAE